MSERYFISPLANEDIILHFCGKLYTFFCTPPISATLNPFPFLTVNHVPYLHKLCLKNIAFRAGDTKNLTQLNLHLRELEIEHVKIIEASIPQEAIRNELYYTVLKLTKLQKFWIRNSNFILDGDFCKICA